MTAENWAARAGTVQFGQLQANRIGLGTNRLNDTEEGRLLLRRAVELGVNFIDTAYRYQSGASETTIGNTLTPYNGLLIATKGGWEDTRPEELQELLETSLKRLKTDHIDLYQLHRVNPGVPIEDSMKVLKRFQDEGKISHIGLSEVSIEQIERARQVAPVASVQNEYNVLERRHEDVVDYCTQNNIVLIPWFPLGGLAGGAAAVERHLSDMAARYQATPQQLALAWLLRRSPIMLPIPGTLSVEHLESNLHAGMISLSDEDYQQLSGAI